jgi:hypothetical protein
MAGRARGVPKGIRINRSVAEAFGRTHRPFVVIPGLDPGIIAYSVCRGDPRITSGDDGDEKS